MKVFIAMLLLAVPAWGQEPAPPTPSQSRETRSPLRRPWLPNEYFYRQIDIDRQNVGTNGRKNALRGEQRTAETPSLRPGLSDWNDITGF